VIPQDVYRIAEMASPPLKDMRDLYAAMRPYVSGQAYVNYCDLDLPNWPDAYWGPNLSHLKRIKSSFDQDNVFRHTQSVPLT
jgi:Berberine and berberine like